MEQATRVLVVADWRTDARSVVAAVAGRARNNGSEFTVVVPAWLHGIDWIGDPRASMPCAEAQAAELDRLLRLAGVHVVSARAGDPSPVAAAGDALDAWPAQEILVFAADNRPTTLFEVSRRIQRQTGLPTTRFGSAPPRPPRFVFGRRKTCLAPVTKPASDH